MKTLIKTSFVLVLFISIFSLGFSNAKTKDQ
jgi:hypothetical protein